MKSNLLRTSLEWALITSLLMSVGFFVWFYSTSKNLRMYDAQLAVAQNHLQSVQSVLGLLGSECEGYAKTNADMARLMDSFRPHPPAAPAAANKPAK